MSPHAPTACTASSNLLIDDIIWYLGSGSGFSTKYYYHMYLQVISIKGTVFGILNQMKLNVNNFDVAIFDIDGTMVDNMNYHLLAWQHF